MSRRLFPVYPIFVLLTIGAAVDGAAQPAAETADESADWVAKSNEHAQLMIDALAEFLPEQASAMGVERYDEAVMDLGPELYERQRASLLSLRRAFDTLLRTETLPKVRQDLDILKQTVDDNLTSNELSRAHLLEYPDVAMRVFRGVRSLIDPQNDPKRYPAAVVRLRKYAGLEPGFQPIAELARARVQERLEIDELAGPYTLEVQRDLERMPTLLDGLKEVLSQSGVEDWETPYEALRTQIDDYAEFLRTAVLPRARSTHVLPQAVYRNRLAQVGVDASPDALIRMGTEAFANIRDEMQSLANLIAHENGWKDEHYLAVIDQLKADQVAGDALLPAYRDVLNRIEEILRRERLVSLPERNAGIRMATEAETAAQPAAHLETPRIIGNTGEFPNFVIPRIPRTEDGAWADNDDSIRARMWTLTAHEARPGHEMQFSRMIEDGVSITRAYFAFNSTNAEGWGVYAEAMVKPHMPLDAQLMSLQLRLLRAARMFLDPMLNTGLISPEEAKSILTDQVGIGERFAQQEVDRYTFRWPGQATAYYFGYARLQALRTRAHLKHGNAFTAQAFHDFILLQGLIPLELLEHVVLNEWRPAPKVST